MQKEFVLVFCGVWLWLWRLLLLLCVVVLCVSWCVLCVVVWSVATLNRDSWLLLSLVRACFEFLATLTFGALREKFTLFQQRSRPSQKNTKKQEQ